MMFLLLLVSLMAPFDHSKFFQNNLVESDAMPVEEVSEESVEVVEESALIEPESEEIVVEETAEEPMDPVLIDENNENSVVVDEPVDVEAVSETVNDAVEVELSDEVSEIVAESEMVEETKTNSNPTVVTEIADKYIYQYCLELTEANPLVENGSNNTENTTASNAVETEKTAVSEEKNNENSKEEKKLKSNSEVVEEEVVSSIEAAETVLDTALNTSDILPEVVEELVVPGVEEESVEVAEESVETEVVEVSPEPVDEVVVTQAASMLVSEPELTLVECRDFLAKREATQLPEPVAEIIEEEENLDPELERWGGTNEHTKKLKEYSQEEKMREKKIKEYKSRKINVRKDILLEMFKGQKFQKYMTKLDNDIYLVDDFFFDQKEKKDPYLKQNQGLIEEMSEKEFTVIFKDKMEIGENSGYFLVDFLFSKEIDYEDFSKGSIVLMSAGGAEVRPTMVLLGKKEAVLVFDMAHFNSYIIKFSGVKELEGSVGTALNGYYSLLSDAGSYVQLTSTIKNVYVAAVGDDLSFQSSKLSFGNFNKMTESDSTIGIELSNADSMSPKCVLLLFGEDLVVDGGDQKISISGVTILPKSTGDVPVDSKVIDSFVSEKQKSFLGFLYFEDMEYSESGNKIFYLNLKTPGGLSLGRYASTFSIEPFCPL